ncbi:hypothetical protein, partial [Nocardioides sp.]|uniref:hypothetical protein n=1 Tax=Nocardioides sp. TaxID=35761 RepID=UPI002B270A0B
LSAADVEAWIQGLTDEELSESELVDRVRLLEELKTRAAAAQARLAVGLDAAVRQRHSDLKLPPA